MYKYKSEVSKIKCVSIFSKCFVTWIFMHKVYLQWTLHLLNFLNEMIHLQLLEMSIIIFMDTSKLDVYLKLVSQQFWAWSDCTYVQTGLNLYWWKRLITFDSSRIRVKNWFYDNFKFYMQAKLKTDGSRIM